MKRLFVHACLGLFLVVSTRAGEPVIFRNVENRTRQPDKESALELIGQSRTGFDLKPSSVEGVMAPWESPVKRERRSRLTPRQMELVKEILRYRLSLIREIEDGEGDEDPENIDLRNKSLKELQDLAEKEVERKERERARKRRLPTDRDREFEKTTEAGDPAVQEFPDNFATTRNFDFDFSADVSANDMFRHSFAGDAFAPGNAGERVTGLILHGAGESDNGLPTGDHRESIGYGIPSSLQGYDPGAAPRISLPSNRPFPTLSGPNLRSPFSSALQGFPNLPEETFGTDPTRPDVNRRPAIFEPPKRSF